MSQKINSTSKSQISLKSVSKTSQKSSASLKSRIKTTDQVPSRRRSTKGFLTGDNVSNRTGSIWCGWIEFLRHKYIFCMPDFFSSKIEKKSTNFPTTQYLQPTKPSQSH